MSARTPIAFFFVWSLAIGLSAVICTAQPPSDDAASPTSDDQLPADEGTDEATTDSARIEPGLVHWHENFEAACTAGQQSGKPVLLFQLLGRLDAADT